jgi:hypothetical protein
MKKAILLPLLLLSMSISAQNSAVSFTVGPVFGLNSYSNPFKDKTVPSNIETKEYGFSTGIFSRLKMSSINIQPEIFYHSHSVALYEDGVPSSNMLTIKSVQCNAVAGVALPGFPDIFKARVLAGAGYVSNIETGATPNNVVIKNTYKKAITGISIDFFKLTAELRYELPIENLLNKNISSNGFKDQMFIATIGYRIF